MISIGNTIVLSDQKEYFIVCNAEFDGNDYYYIIEKNNPFNVKFCLEKLIGGEVALQELTDLKVIKKLYPIFQKNFKKYMGK